MSTETVNKDKEEKDGKITEKFNKNFKRMVALLNGQEMFKTIKLGNEEVRQAVAELVTEQKTKLVVEFKAKVVGFVEKRKEYLKFRKVKEAEIKKAFEEKEKEMNAEMDKTYELIDKIEALEAEYYQMLTGESATAESLTPENPVN